MGNPTLDERDLYNTERIRKVMEGTDMSNPDFTGPELARIPRATEEEANRESTTDSGDVVEEESVEEVPAEEESVEEVPAEEEQKDLLDAFFDEEEK